METISVDYMVILPGLGNVRKKQNFLQVREKSGNFEKMSGNFCHLTHVKELSGNFVMPCQGIVMKFCYDIYF